MRSGTNTLLALVLLCILGVAGGFFGQRKFALGTARKHDVAVALSEVGPVPAPEIDRGPQDGGDGAVGTINPASPQPAGPTPAEFRAQTIQIFTDLVRRRLFQAANATFSVSATNGRTPANMIDAMGNLGSGFGGLFGLSDDQAAALQTEVTGIRQKVNALISANTTVHLASEAEAAALRLQLEKLQQSEAALGRGNPAPPPVIGGEIYVLEISGAPGALALREEFLAAMRGALGEVNYEKFAILNGQKTGPAGQTASGPEVMFGDFGGESRRITIAKTDGRYSYVNELLSKRSGAMRSIVRGHSRESARAVLGVAFELLPPDF